jgi:hypothetical protein
VAVLSCVTLQANRNCTSFLSCTWSVVMLTSSYAAGLNGWFFDIVGARASQPWCMAVALESRTLLECMHC